MGQWQSQHRGAMVILMTVAAFSASCSAPPAEPPAPKPATRRAPVAVPQPGDAAAVSAAGPAATTQAATSAEPAAPVQTRKTIGQTTQEVLDLADAVARGGVVADGSGPTEGGALGTYAGAYRGSAARIGGLQVEQKMKLHQAEHGSLPATHAEFMEKIIARGKPDAVSLPMLPYYQEYAFDPDSKSLVIVEFPAKKEQRRRETGGNPGP